MLGLPGPPAGKLVGSCRARAIPLARE